jgi:colanic acid biosynthesis protein WcaH
MLIPSEHYDQILKIMPIPCVDLVVQDRDGLILLLKRKNEPAKGQWWFPGGRVHYMETRHDAAIRKLKEECGLESTEFQELGTFDIMLKNPHSSSTIHGITTLFKIKIANHKRLRLDDQSEAFDWKLPCEWEIVNLSPFIKNSLRRYL